MTPVSASDMTTSPLARTDVERSLSIVQAELGQADKRRLAALPPLMKEDHRIRMSE